MIILLFLIALVLIVIAYTSLPMFGQVPVGDRLDRIKKSPNFKDGKFHNLHPTPALTEGVSYYTVLKEFFFRRNLRRKPSDIIPSKKTNLLSLKQEDNVLVWFGHSSYFVQIDGKKFLVDPVLNGSASPIKATTRSFPGADIYTAADIPEIDYLFISHDHWDHLDYETIKQLKPKINKIICGLGTGQHFERWGFGALQIIEKDWGDEILLEEGFVVNITPARHFSGRSFKRNPSLWVSFALKTPSMKIFMGGDSGYDTHFANIGEQHGPFDLAILECGQYDKSWKYIHMMPEEIIQAAFDLKASHLMPVHWGKFSLSNHSWDDPIIRVAALASEKNLPLVTPLIGECIDLQNFREEYTQWWEKMS